MTITARLTALRHMTPGQLRERYQQVFGEPTRTGNKEFLVKRIAWRIQSLAEGGLSERARKRAEELARDADLRMTIPKQKMVAAGAVARSPGAVVPIPGTVLTRQYKGKTLQVTVLADGFDYRGDKFRSLSAVARSITGTQWNGHLFFGLKKDQRRAIS